MLRYVKWSLVACNCHPGLYRIVGSCNLADTDEWASEKESATAN